MNKRNTKTILYLGVVLIFVVVVAGFTLNSLYSPSSEYKDITVQQAMELIETNPSLVILDVRTEEEFSSGHLYGAINIPVDSLQQRLNELNPNDEILVYCRTGNRSTTAANILVEGGFTDFYHMVGGIVAWEQAGYHFYHEPYSCAC